MRKIFTIILSVIAYTPIYGGEVIWEFDQLTETGITDTTQNYSAKLNDVATNEQTLVAGLYNHAFVFEGNKHKFQVENSATISLTNNFTISCVFKPSRINTYRTLLWKGNRAVSPQQINYWLSLNDGKPEFKFKDQMGKWFIATSPKPLSLADQWCYLVVTMDNKGEIIGYLNGQVCFREVYEPAELTTNNYPAYIGSGALNLDNTSGHSFAGLIDRLSISSGVNPPTLEEITEFKRLVKLDTATLNAQKLQQRQLYLKSIKKSSLSPDKSAELPLGELKRLADMVKYHEFYKRNVNGKKMIITTLPTTSRVLQVDDYTSGKFSLTHQASISSARNEYEGFQIILLGNPDQKLEKISITIPDLISTTGDIILAKHVEWGVIRSIKSDKPKYDVKYVGDYPDAIMEGQQSMVSIPKNGFTPVYVRVKIAADVVAGYYRGEIKVGEQVIDLKLQVYDFTLPVTSSCKVAFTFTEEIYRKWYNMPKLTDKDKLYIYDFLLKYRITPNNIYSREIYPELKFLPELKKKGANFFTLGYLRYKHPVDDKTLQQIIAKYRTRFDLLKKSGFGEDSYLYAFDEITSQTASEQAAAKQIMTALNQALPELKTLQTSSPHTKSINQFNTWAPLFSYFANHTDEIKSFKNTGNKFWWYCADDPVSPFPNFFLDYPVFNNRIIFTLSYLYNIDGVLYWSINREWTTNLDIQNEWPDKPWKPYITNPYSNKRVYKNGMGNYVYPGKNGRILPSLRLENLRDGIEDYEYLVMLKKLALASNNEQAQNLTHVPANVALKVNQYSSNPANLANYRNKVALMIEKLKSTSKF
ncbi:MAG: DUF4091 domain-containing protein [Verrucomicrobiales bacterium]|nr:DUF4091 domain-containing protein [Verrucomicrobiales bacterium]